MAVDVLKPVWPKSTRQKFIIKLQKSSTTIKDGAFPLWFQGRLENFPVYRVPIDLPVYRLKNGRTLAKQEEYIAKYNLKDNYFKKDPESEEALKAQHKILKAMVEKDNILLRYFKENTQVEPLILTQEGYVINGNRRLCAFRLLLTENPKKYNIFQYIRVILLPPCTEKDIDMLESALQIAPDIKEKYSWIGRAMLLRYRQYENGWSIKELASINKMDESDVLESIDMLDYADEYLDSIGHSKEYSRIEDSEFAFKQIRKFRHKCNDPIKSDYFTQICYSIIENPAIAQDRAYKVIADAYKYIDKITPKLEELAKKNEIKNVKNPKKVVKNKNQNLELLGTSKENKLKNSKTVMTFLSKPEHRKVVCENTKKIIDREKTIIKELKNTNFCIDKLADAHSNLQDIITHINESSNLEGVEKNLINLELLIKDIRKKVSKLK